MARERRERQLRAAQADTKLVQVQVVEMRKQYAQERRDWQAHEGQLKQQVAELQRRGGYREAVAAGGSLAELQVDPATLERITVEIREQEGLIGGYQKENERLTEELRAARGEARGAAAAAETREGDARRQALLASQAAVHRGDDGTEGLQAQLERARADAERASEQWQLREVEMRCDIDRLRATKRELEARLHPPLSMLPPLGMPHTLSMPHTFTRRGWRGST